MKRPGRMGAITTALREARHVAIVRLGSIGDVVATLPIAWFLKDLLDREVRITWIVHEGAAHLLHGVPALDEVVSLPKGSLLKAVPVWKKILADRDIDAVLDVHGNLKSGIVSLLTGAAARIGFHRRDCREHWNPFFTNLKLPPLGSNNKTRRAIEIAQLVGHPQAIPRFGFVFDTQEEERARRVLSRVGLEERPLAVLQLARLEDIRSWPPEHYARLAERLLAGGYTVLVLGGPPEEESGEKVRDLLPETRLHLHFEINTLSLREVGALLKILAADAKAPHVFVGGDSGCLHLAAACGVRSIGFFGPQDPNRTAPLGRHVENLFHPEAATCIPCARRECFHPTRSFCMKSITADEVAGRVLEPYGESTPESRDQVRGATLPEATREGSASGPRDAPLTPAAKDGGAGPASPLLGRELTWTLLLAVILLSLRSTSAGELTEVRQLPGLGPLLKSMDWLGQVLGVVSGSGLVFLTFLMGRRSGATKTGILSAVLLLGTALFIDLSATSPATCLFALLINLSFLLFLEGEVREGWLRRWGGALAALASLLAFVVHGVLGVILPAVALIAFRAGEKALGKLVRLRALISGGLVAASAAVWLVTMQQTQTEGVASDETVADLPAAFFAPLVVPASGVDPVWAYVAWLALRCLPASVLVPFALFAHLKNRRYREDLGFADRRWRYAKSVFLSGFILLSLLPMKDPRYLHALLPGLSVLSAAWLEKRWETWIAGPKGAVKARSVSWLLLVIGILTLGALLVFAPLHVRGMERWTHPALFVVGWFLATRSSPATVNGLSMRLLIDRTRENGLTTNVHSIRRRNQIECDYNDQHGDGNAQHRFLDVPFDRIDQLFCHYAGTLVNSAGTRPLAGTGFRRIQ